MAKKKSLAQIACIAPDEGAVSARMREMLTGNDKTQERRDACEKLVRLMTKAIVGNDGDTRKAFMRELEGTSLLATFTMDGWFKGSHDLVTFAMVDWGNEAVREWAETETAKMLEE